MGGNVYEMLMEKAEKCFQIATKVSSVSLKAFWYSAYRGYKEKALNVPLEKVI